MLYTIAVVLLILWLLGLVTATTMGGFIHVLLVIAIGISLLRVINGQRPLWPTRRAARPQRPGCPKAQSRGSPSPFTVMLRPDGGDSICTWWVTPRNW